MQSGIHMLRLTAVWLTLAAVYVLFVGSVSANESVVCAACASLCTAWWAFAGHRSGIRFCMSGPVLRPLVRPVLALPRSTLRVGADLTRVLSGYQGHGSLLHAPDTGTGWARAEGPSAAAVRAIGLFAASLTPDSYVLRLDQHGAVMEHALSRNEAGT